jgi:hypothetical protein
MKVSFKGIVRGAYSDYQHGMDDSENLSVMKFSGSSLEEALKGLVLPEWIFILKVNGRRISDPVKYLKLKGVWHMCIREEEAA